MLEREVRKGVGAVDDNLDAARARHLADSLDRKDLAGEVGDVAHKDDFGARRDRALEAIEKIVHRRRRHGERNHIELDAIAALALAPRVYHSAIILRRRQHFIARLEVETE